MITSSAMSLPEIPASPFPELKALEQKRPVPTLAKLLRGGPSLPSTTLDSPSLGRTVLRVPSFPCPPQAPARDEPDSGKNLGNLPPADSSESLQETLASLMEEPDEDSPAQPDSGEPDAPDALPVPSSPSSSDNTAGEAGATDKPAGEAEATDEDLVNALRPLLQASMDGALFSPQSGLHSYLEPMLRSTVRRAIAEQMENSRQFSEVGAFDRLAWRLRALFTSRSYDDIVFDRTRRHQVEEAYLIRRKSKSLVSYASHDPARHSNPRRIQSTVRSLCSRLQAPDGSIETTFDLPEKRLGLVREGKHCLLVAVLRGRSNALVRADLDYILRQVEDRFGKELELRSDAFIHVLQPLLEGCLLIQSPSPPH